MVREFPLMLTDMVRKPQDKACYRMPGYDGDAFEASPECEGPLHGEKT